MKKWLKKILRYEQWVLGQFLIWFLVLVAIGLFYLIFNTVSAL